MGTIGRLVYDIHHDPVQYGVEKITAASLQALHIAAHLDAIERLILPDLSEGRWVILDRFWWSTWVYGRVARVERTTLDALIQAERLHWKGVQPDAFFLIDRYKNPFDNDTGFNSGKAIRSSTKRRRTGTPSIRFRMTVQSTSLLNACLRQFEAHSECRGWELAETGRLDPAQGGAIVSSVIGRKDPIGLHQASPSPPDSCL